MLLLPTFYAFFIACFVYRDMGPLKAQDDGARLAPAGERSLSAAEAPVAPRKTGSNSSCAISQASALRANVSETSGDRDIF